LESCSGGPAAAANYGRTDDDRTDDAMQAALHAERGMKKEEGMGWCGALAGGRRR